MGDMIDAGLVMMKYALVIYLGGIIMLFFLYQDKKTPMAHIKYWCIALVVYLLGNASVNGFLKEDIDAIDAIEKRKQDEKNAKKIKKLFKDDKNLWKRF